MAKKTKKELKEQLRLDRRTGMEEQYPDVVEWIEDHFWQDEHSDFLNSLHQAYEKYGGLTDKQVEAIRKVIESRSKQLEERMKDSLLLEDVDPISEGRHFLVGQIVFTKVKYTDYGPTRKMMVRLVDGNKVWGTVPKDIREYIEEAEVDYPGLAIKFDATVTRSENDPHFGFFTRPAKVEIL